MAQRLQGLDRVDAAFVASDVAIDLYNYVQRGSKRFERVKELATMIRNATTVSELFILEKAVPKHYNSGVKLVEDVRARGQEIAGKLESTPNLSREDAERLAEFCVDLSKAIMDYRAEFYSPRRYLAA